jgi:hypothetical protein
MSQQEARDDAWIEKETLRWQTGSYLNLTGKKLNQRDAERVLEPLLTMEGSLLLAFDLLSLNYNMLTKVPLGVCRLQNLTQIGVCNNQITQLPRGFGNFPKLDFLDISDNLIVRLPTSLTKLTTLRKLVIRGNRTLLERIPGLSEKGEAPLMLKMIGDYFEPLEERYRCCISSIVLLIGVKRHRSIELLRLIDKGVVLMIARMMHALTIHEWEKPVE